jgi:hypothetical protein
MMLLLMVLLATIGGCAGGCLRGEWEGFVQGHGTACIACLEGHYCPDGVSMLPCARGTRTIGEGNAQCCDAGATCGIEGYAIVKAECRCRAMACDAPKRLMQYTDEGGRFSYECVHLPECNPCPGGNVWVQTRGCQCVRRAACTNGQLWGKNNGFECVPF